MVEVRTHGVNGEAEFGIQKLSLADANNYLLLLKSVDFFVAADGEFLKYTESTLEGIDTNQPVLNIYTQII